MLIIKTAKSLLDQPKDYPTAMVEALTILFSQCKLEHRAFLTLMHDQAVDEQPNLLVLLEMDGDPVEIDALINKVGNVSSEMIANEEPVDFCLVSEKERGVSHYLITYIWPFYQRRWGS